VYAEFAAAGTRWERQDLLDGMQARLEQTPNAMRIRRSTVEHPYATIKAWMGSTHFLTKGLERVKAEMSLHMLAYNFRRLMSLLGMPVMLAAIRAYAHFLALQGLLEGFALTALLKMLKWDYKVWNALYVLELALARTIRLAVRRFEFLHRLSRLQTSVRPHSRATTSVISSKSRRASCRSL